VTALLDRVANKRKRRLLALGKAPCAAAVTTKKKPVAARCTTGVGARTGKKVRPRASSLAKEGGGGSGDDDDGSGDDDDNSVLGPLRS
jgi:hypothetical protein